MQSWYLVAIPRQEVREGRSFNPDEFAIALEQVAAGRGPLDYRDPEKFVARTCFTRALREHLGMVLRRLSGQTENCPPVLTLITQFGGGKTHTLTALFHLAKAGNELKDQPDIRSVLAEHGLNRLPNAKVAVFVGNAWDPQPGRETPWIDVARQLAGDKGVEALGQGARSSPPGTEALNRVFQLAGGSVLILFDEVLNFMNRHREMSASLYAFIQNLTVAMTGTTHSAAVISLPRSQVEMTDEDLDWQEKITKVVRRVSKDLIVNDDAEISEVLRKRLFDDIGPEKARNAVAKAYADWCFERRDRLPHEWMNVDTSLTESRAKDYLRQRFEVCYPFHPATISVFHRKWQTLRQFQQTRGALAMFAQWISWSFVEAHRYARSEPLITLGSAPLEVNGFRASVLGSIGEPRLSAAIDTDIAGVQSHARVLDADFKGQLKDLHRRVATAILFESSGGMTDKAAHLPELRFALGEPGLETTSIDNAAIALESKGFYIRRRGTDGYSFGYEPTLKKVVSDRRASLDEEEIRQSVRKVVQVEFERGRSLPLLMFPEDGTAIMDTPRLTVVILDPEQAWEGNGKLREHVAQWTTHRGKSPRLYPGAILWCVRKQGRDLKDKVELMLAWQRVRRELLDGTLAGDYSRTEVDAKVRDAEEAAREEVWAAYRYVLLADSRADFGIKAIDLGAGHATSGETLQGRIITALKSAALLNDAPGAGYLERKWPVAFKDTGAWPLSSLRKAFLDGSMERLIDPDAYLRNKLPEFVMRGDFGFGSGPQPNGGYSRVWFQQMLPPEEITFDSEVFLLTSAVAKRLTSAPPTLADSERTETAAVTQKAGEPEGLLFDGDKSDQTAAEAAAASATRTIRLSGAIPTEVWTRLGRSLIPKLKSGSSLRLGIDVELTIQADSAAALRADLKQIISDLALDGQLKIE
ncbi:MAG: DUF499 domain-containing protein [Acidobacteriia bacterium]|nr:DUF499 domain-containing protein [Terriglobia bacterium]